MHFHDATDAVFGYRAYFREDEAPSRVRVNGHGPGEVGVGLEVDF